MDRRWDDLDDETKALYLAATHLQAVVAQWHQGRAAFADLRAAVVGIAGARAPFAELYRRCQYGEDLNLSAFEAFVETLEMD